MLLEPVQVTLAVDTSCHLRLRTLNSWTRKGEGSSSISTTPKHHFVCSDCVLSNEREFQIYWTASFQSCRNETTKSRWWKTFGTFNKEADQHVSKILRFLHFNCGKVVGKLTSDPTCRTTDRPRNSLKLSKSVDTGRIQPIESLSQEDSMVTLKQELKAERRLVEQRLGLMYSCPHHQLSLPCFTHFF